ncbi:MAG TPA: 4-hydroxybutyrate CoA-transferase, partial [Hyphomicrobiaceae bacterium]
MAEELDVAGLLRPGDRLAWSAGPMEPTDLIGVLGRQLDRVPRISVLLNLSLQTTIDAARLASRATVTALGGAVTNRRFQEIGALDVLPINYSTLPDLVASGRLAIDVVLLQVAAEGDAYNLSLMVDHLADAVPRARAVVAEINDCLPVTCGETRIQAADVDHTVRVSRPPFELPSRSSRAIEREIAAHVCRLVGDGATLQIGLGSLPDAVLESLTSKRDLGLHSGTIGDRAVELIEAGVITNRKKTVDT